ncbi:mitochondrial carrier protein, coenzyme A transporter [Pseudohyphozyma bogoriensis]|nr:mitochondrial carrier protein, coenzyme A transporter [Pseudohyphozyma bogoriensis]
MARVNTSLDDSSSPRASTSQVTLDHHGVDPDHSNVPQPRSRRTGATPDPSSLRYAITSGVAGGLAGCIAKTSVAPLDRVKILFQTRSPDYQRYAGTWLGVFRAGRDIYAETGIRGLLQGHSATLLRIFPYAAINETSALRFAAGSLAGVTSALFTYPLELIRVRLAFEHHSASDSPASLRATIRQIYLEPPLPLPSRSSPSPPPRSPPSAMPSKPSLTHFYRGVFPTLLGIVPYAGTSFLVWGYLKHDVIATYFTPETRARHSHILDLFAGGLAGAIGQTSAYPLDIIRRRMQVGPAVQPGRRSGFWETAQQVYKGQGWRGFFVGLSIGYLKVIPMNAVSFASWEALKVMFGLEDKKRAERRRKEVSE